MHLPMLKKWCKLKLLGLKISQIVLVVNTLVASLFFQTATANEIERPSIWVKSNERSQILEKIHTEDWAKALFKEMQQRVDKYANERPKVRRNTLQELPLIWLEDKSQPPTLPNFRVKGGGNSEQLKLTVKSLQDGVDCGVLYFLTQKNKYAACGADILYTFINALSHMKVHKDGPMNASWMFPTDHLYEARVIGAQLPIIYDFVYPYLKSGGKVYDIASDQLTAFNFNAAQNTFETYVWLALNKGLFDSNWPVLESSSLVHNILALDDAEKIQSYLPYYTHINTKNQASLKKVAQNFANEGDMWPESFQYSQHVAAYSVYLMTLLDRYDPSLKLGAKYPNIPAAFKSYYDLQFPNGDYPFIGDGHRTYPVEYSALEMSYLLAKLNDNKKQQLEFGNYLASSIKQGVYHRDHLHKRSYKAAPYFTPTQLLWYTNKIESSGEVDVAPPRPRTKRLEHAGMNIQRNTTFKNPEKNSLMGFMAGGSYIHGHASGIDMELYGQGYVLGVTGGKSKYRTDIHENYYRIFASHNTVVSNGASASKGGWINLGINKVEAVALEPAYGKPGVSPKHSFTTSSFYDKFNLVAPAQHQRTLALIKVSDTQGYYLDIFRAKSESKNQFHDYIYHNLGDNLEIQFSDNTDQFKNNPTRYQASANLPWTLQRQYRHPGWHFFNEVKTHSQTQNGFNATFSASELTDRAIYMRATVPAGLPLEVTKAKAPQSYGAAEPYNKKPTPTMVLRKQGDAWQHPFVVAFESKSEGQQYVVQKIERIIEDNAFKGVKVALLVDGSQLTQYVIVQEDINQVFEDSASGIYFKGRFAIITVSANNQVTDMYIGQGHHLKYQDTVLKPSLGQTSAYSKF